MKGHRMDLGLFTDVLDVLDRHGFARGDDRARRAGPSLLIRTWPASTKAPRTTRSGPLSTRRHAPRTGPEPSGQDSRHAVIVPASELTTVLAALDIAADCKRDRAEMCADCPDQSCPACQTRLHDARAYDQMAGRMLQAAGSRPGRPPRAGPSPAGPPRQSSHAADKEAGQ